MRNCRRIIRHRGGSVLIQVMVATAMIGGLGVLIARSVDQMNTNFKRVQTISDRERAMEDIMFILQPSDACMNTFTGGSLSPGGSLTGRVSIFDDTSPAPIERFRACGINCAQDSYDSYMSSSRLRLKSFSLQKYDDTTNLAKFRAVFLNNRNRETAIERDFLVETDAAELITRCSSQTAEPLEEMCNAFNGTLEEAAPEYCKSLWVNNPLNTTDSNFAAQIVGNVQVTRDLLIEGGALQVGGAASYGTTGQGRMDVDGRAYIRNTLNVGTGAFADSDQNENGKGQVQHSVWVGSGNRPVGMVAGELRTASDKDLDVEGAIMLPSISATQTFTPATATTTAVNIGWVKRQIAESVVGGADIATVVSEIFGAAVGTETEAEEVLRRAFCSTVRIYDIEGNPISASDPLTCQVLLNHLQDSDKCNINGRCPNVRADTICFGPDADADRCQSQWPTSLRRIASGCEPRVFSHSGNGAEGQTVNVYYCPLNKPWLIYDHSSNECCPYRLVN